MQNSAAGGTELTQQICEKLRRAGVRLTHQRLEICRVVLARRDHPSAESVHKAARERLPTVSLDTVYRTLWLLNDLGLVTALSTSHGHMRFDPRTDAHHHFVCTHCGALADFGCGEFDHLSVPEEVRRMGQVLQIHVELRGLCKVCAGKLTRRDAPGIKYSGS